MVEECMMNKRSESEFGAEVRHYEYRQQIYLYQSECQASDRSSCKIYTAARIIESIVNTNIGKEFDDWLAKNPYKFL